MAPEFMQIINFLLAIFVILVILIVSYQIRKKLVLKRKLEEYSALLKQAVETRRAFYDALEKSKLAFARLDATKNELADSKARLSDCRDQLRGKLKEIREHTKKEEMTKIDKHHLAQLKMKFGQHWNLFNSMKMSYLGSQSDHPKLQEEYDKIAALEQGAYKIWIQNKTALMRAYTDVRKLTKIKHPNEILGKDSTRSLL